METLDRHDIVLLQELQRDSRQTVQQLAERVSLSSTPCWKRIKEMEAAGVILGYTALVDREKVGLALCVIAEVNLTRHTEDEVTRFEKAIADVPQVVGCYSTTGQADYVIKVLAPDIKSYERFLHETMFKLQLSAVTQAQQVLGKEKWEEIVENSDRAGWGPGRGPGMMRQR